MAQEPEFEARIPGQREGLAQGAHVVAALGGVVVAANLQGCVVGRPVGLVIRDHPFPVLGIPVQEVDAAAHVAERHVLGPRPQQERQLPGQHALAEFEETREERALRNLLEQVLNLLPARLELPGHEPARQLGGEADAGILFRPPENVIREYPDFPVTQGYEELREAFMAGEAQCAALA